MWNVKRFSLWLKKLWAEGPKGCAAANLVEGSVRCSVVNSRGHHTHTPCPRVPITLFSSFEHGVQYLTLHVHEC